MNAFSQPGAEIGVMGGVGYYLGDYNPSTHFKDMRRYVGGFYRYNLNDRFAFRVNAGFSKLDVKRGGLLDNAGVAQPEGFTSPVTDISGVVEFNFKSFMVAKTKESSFWAPYLFTGVGFISTEAAGSLTIPLGVGVKFNLYRQFSCGIEWSARKTFSDILDGLNDPWKTGESNFIYNKDWFFVTGITISYRFPMSPECHF